MAMATRLEMRHGQSLVMTPKLQQSIRLVQLNNIELSAFIDSELEKYPLLERQDGAISESESPEEGGRESLDGELTRFGRGTMLLPPSEPEWSVEILIACAPGRLKGF